MSSKISAWECKGTLVDCVQLAKHVVLKGQAIDLCVSGINHGSNASINIIYSQDIVRCDGGLPKGSSPIGQSPVGLQPRPTSNPQTVYPPDRHTGTHLTAPGLQVVECPTYPRVRYSGHSGVCQAGGRLVGSRNSRRPVTEGGRLLLAHR